MPFAPSDLANLWGWWKADNAFQDTSRTIPAVLTDDPVESFEDLSGNGRHLTPYTSGCLMNATGGPNGTKAVRMIGVMRNPSEVMLGPFNYFYVGTCYWAIPQYSSLHMWYNNGNFYPNFNFADFAGGSNGNGWLQGGFGGAFGAVGAAMGAVPENTLWVSLMNLAGTMSKLIYGRATLAEGMLTLTPEYDIAQGGPFRLGGYDKPMSEIIMYQRSLSDAEILQVQTYLNDKYAFWADHVGTVSDSMTVSEGQKKDVSLHYDDVMTVAEFIAKEATLFASDVVTMIQSLGNWMGLNRIFKTKRFKVRR